MPCNSQARKNGVQSIVPTRSSSGHSSNTCTPGCLGAGGFWPKSIGARFARASASGKRSLVFCPHAHRGPWCSPAPLPQHRDRAACLREAWRPPPPRGSHRAHGSRAFVIGINLERGMNLRSRRSADQQRHVHPGALHLFGDRDHLIQRRRDEAGKPDHIGFVVVRGF